MRVHAFGFGFELAGVGTLKLCALKDMYCSGSSLLWKVCTQDTCTKNFAVRKYFKN